MEASSRRTSEPPSSGSGLPIAVCVPARDETETLPGLLAALEAQVDVAPDGLVVCVYLDGGTNNDGLALAARSRTYRWPLKFEVGARSAVPSAGRARARAMALGLEFANHHNALILTTDADSVPAPNWITRMRESLAHADVVAGRIFRRGARSSPLLDRVETYLDRLHAFRRRLDPVVWEVADAHHQTGGANLGFRGATYRAIGGFALVASDEDVGIVAAASRAGFRVARDPRSIVVTSDRRTGRATGGLADALARLDLPGANAEVDHPEDAAWQYRMHALARAAFARGTPADAASALGTSVDRAVAIARESPNGEAFAMRIVPVRPGGIRRIPLADAERVLVMMTMAEPAPAAVA